MPTRSTTRRSAVVLAIALIGMFLIVLTGSARVAQTRVGAITGQAGPSPQHGRHTTAIAPAPHDQSTWHADLASTPPADSETLIAFSGEHIVATPLSILTTDAIAAVGRAPPAH